MRRVQNIRPEFLLVEKVLRSLGTFAANRHDSRDSQPYSSNFC